MAMTKKNEKTDRNGGEARCVSLADKGIRTASDLTAVMLRLVADAGKGRVTVGQGTLMCKAASVALASEALRYRYGQKVGRDRILQLSSDEEE